MLPLKILRPVQGDVYSAAQNKKLEAAVTGIPKGESVEEYFERFDNEKFFRSHGPPAWEEVDGKRVYRLPIDAGSDLLGDGQHELFLILHGGGEQYGGSVKFRLDSTSPRLVRLGFSGGRYYFKITDSSGINQKSVQLTGLGSENLDRLRKRYDLRAEVMLPDGYRYSVKGSNPDGLTGIGVQFADSVGNTGQGDLIEKPQPPRRP